MYDGFYSTLDTAPIGAKARIKSLNAGPGLATRLMQMGLTPGTEIEILNNRRGPILLKVRGVTIALGRGMAKKIIVEILTR